MPDTETDLMRALHDEHARPLWAYVVSLTGDHAVAHDIVQETLLRAWRHPQVIDPVSGSPRAWLFTVARNLVVDASRTRRSRSETVTAALPEQSVDDTDDVLQSWVVAEALRQLSADHRAVLVECYYRGSSVAEAARRLDVPEGTVKSRTHYALERLRVALAEMGVGR